jgi:hexosaminidase
VAWSGILSSGYYIDLIHPAVDHYLNDPIPANTTLRPEQQRRILGGEATMWSEWVTPETIDSRVWPRTAAIAERLWSPRDVRDVDDMYRRLAVVSRRLEEAGANHKRNIDPMIRRFAGDTASPEELRAL